jgi:hypothetical protein
MVPPSLPIGTHLVRRISTEPTHPDNGTIGQIVNDLYDGYSVRLLGDTLMSRAGQNETWWFCNADLPTCPVLTARNARLQSPA